MSFIPAPPTMMLPISAVIIVENEPGSGRGESHQIKLYAVPRVGELVGLYTVGDTAADEPKAISAWKHFEVVQVLHEVEDLTRKENYHRDSHRVALYVKPSTDKNRPA